MIVEAVASTITMRLLEDAGLICELGRQSGLSISARDALCIIHSTVEHMMDHADEKAVIPA